MGLGIIKNGKNRPLAGAVRHNKVMTWSKSVANPYARRSNEDPQPTIPFVFNDIPAGVYVYSPLISGDGRTAVAFGNVDSAGACNSYDYSYIEAVPGLEYLNPIGGGMRLDWGYESSKHTPFVLHQDVPVLTIILAIGNSGEPPDKIYAASASVKLTRISDVPIEGVRR